MLISTFAMVTPADGAEIGWVRDRLDFLRVCDRLAEVMGSAGRLLGLDSGTRGELVPPWTL